MWVKVRGYAKKVCEKAGVIFIGYQNTKERDDKGYVPLVMFNDPKTKTTLCIKADELSVWNVTEMVKESREKFKK